MGNYCDFLNEIHFQRFIVLCWGSVLGPDTQEISGRSPSCSMDCFAGLIGISWASAKEEEWVHRMRCSILIVCLSVHLLRYRSTWRLLPKSLPSQLEPMRQSTDRRTLTVNCDWPNLCLWSAKSPTAIDWKSCEVITIISQINFNWSRALARQTDKRRPWWMLPTRTNWTPVQVVCPSFSSAVAFFRRWFSKFKPKWSLKL